MTNRLGDYLFVYDNRQAAFPERWRVLRQGDPTDLSDIAELTGVVHDTDVPKMKARFEAEYSKPRYDVSTAFANTWAAVRNNYRGLRDHD